MKPNQPNPYLRTKIMTASPEELRMMLYDGAIKFCRQAKEAWDKGDHEPGYHAIMRAQKIVLELSSSLNHNADPQLCEKLSSLYTYIYRLLVDANMDRQPGKIEEALKLLEYEAQTWRMLMGQLAQQGGADPRDSEGARQTAISSLSAEA